MSPPLRERAQWAVNIIGDIIKAILDSEKSATHPKAFSKGKLYSGKDCAKPACEKLQDSHLSLNWKSPIGIEENISAHLCKNFYKSLKVFVLFHLPFLIIDFDVDFLFQELRSCFSRRNFNSARKHPEKNADWIGCLCPAHMEVSLPFPLPIPFASSLAQSRNLTWRIVLTVAFELHQNRLHRRIMQCISTIRDSSCEAGRSSTFFRKVVFSSLFITSQFAIFRRISDFRAIPPASETSIVTQFATKAAIRESYIDDFRFWWQVLFVSPASIVCGKGSDRYHPWGSFSQKAET